MKPLFPSTNPAAPDLSIPAVRLSKTILALLVLLAGSGFWAARQLALHAAKQELVRLQADTVQVQERLTANRAALQSARETLQKRDADHRQALAAVTRLERELASVAPETKWAEPPFVWPDWNPESPYVWMRKELVMQFPIKIFSDDGMLTPDMAAILNVPEPVQAKLNSQLHRLLDDYRQLEISKTERLTAPPPGIGVGNSASTISIQVPPLPEEGARLKDQFEAALRTDLGEQRAALVTDTAEGWLNAQFSQYGTEPKIVTVERHPDGSYNVSTKTGNSSLSVGGVRQLDEYVPVHLLPFFQSLQEQ